MEELNYLKDLNNNSEFYYGKFKNNIFKKLTNYIGSYKNFRSFKESKATKTLYLFGPKGSSKTTFLLYMAYSYRLLNTKTLYFNFEYIKNKNIIEIKKRIYYELLYFCKDISEMKLIQTKKIFQNLEQIKNVMQLIYELIEVLLNIVDCKNINRIIIIDNINHETDDKTLSYLNNIIELLNDEKYSSVKIIICGRGTYFNKIFFKLFQGFQVMTNEEDLFYYQENELVYLYQGDNDEIQNIKKMNKNIFEESDEKLILKEVSELDVYDFYGLYFSEELNGNSYNNSEISKKIDAFTRMPIEYFKIEEKQGNIKFIFYNNLFKKSIKTKIGFEVEKGTLTHLLEHEGYPRTFSGVCFEKIITLLLKHNKLNIDNLKFNKDNVKEIEKISMLKEKSYSGQRYIIEENDEPLLILQENFYGPLYDLVIITKHEGYYYSDFIQIGVDKTKQQIENIINDLQGNYSLYKKNIFQVFGIKTDYISVLFIFDYITQQSSQFKSGTKLCIDKNINFYLFSYKNTSLYELIDKNEKNIEDNLRKVNEYFPSFIINEDKTKLNYSIQLKKKKKGTDKKNKKGNQNKNTRITDYFS